MPLDRAARVGDPIAHTQSEGWGLGMALAGALVGLLVVVTAPVSVPVLLGVATVTGGALIGKGLGESIGSGRRSNAEGLIILEGARTVFTGPGMPNAARMTDPVLCHEGKKIADGSDSVFIEGWNASRRKDETWCAGKIEDGCHTVEIGGNTIGQAGSEARSELSEGYRTFFRYVEAVNTISSLGAKKTAEEVVLWGAGAVVNAYGQSDAPGARYVAAIGGTLVDAVSIVRGDPPRTWNRRDMFENGSQAVGRANDLNNLRNPNEPPRTYTIRI